MPHLHLSLAGRRRPHPEAHEAAATCAPTSLAVIARARALRPGIALGADLIAGFPTETEALFADTLAFVAEAEIPFLHVFPYSERPGTPAARMPPCRPPSPRARGAPARGRARQRRPLLRRPGRPQVASVLAETANGRPQRAFRPRAQVAATAGRPAARPPDRGRTTTDCWRSRPDGARILLAAERRPRAQHPEADRRASARC